MLRTYLLILYYLYFTYIRCVTCFNVFILLICSVNTNVADIGNLLVALAAAEINISDLTDSASVACTYIDTIGDPSIDCCISGANTAASGDRDKFVCVGRAAATALGITTGTSCQECPSGVIT